MSDPRAFLDEVGAAGTEDIDLAGAALACAALVRPGLDLAPFRAHLTGLGPAARGALENLDNHREVAAALAATLHGVFGYIGDRKTYDDLGNADLPTVIERRRGLPVTLGILYIHTARALGATAHGINFPGHFLVGIATRTGAVLLDPFNGGRSVDGDDLEAMLPRGTPLDQGHIAALSDRGTLIRLQNNIVTRAREAEDWPRVAVTLETLMRIAPDTVQYRYEWGAALARIEQPSAARAALAEALLREPSAPWATHARALLGTLTRSLN